MMGLMYLFAFIIYCVLFIGVVMGAIKVAKAKGTSKILWGGMAAFIMYNLVFWDFLPTLLLHQYYCKKEAGFWVYKTAEQWRKENPDVVVGSVKPPEGMVLNERGSGEMGLSDGTRWEYIAGRVWPSGQGYDEARLSFITRDGNSGFWMNNHFIYKIETKKNGYFPVRINRTSIIDGIKKEILVSRVTVDAGYGEEGKKLLRFWTNFNDCGPRADIENPFYRAYENLNNNKWGQSKVF